MILQGWFSDRALSMYVAKKHPPLFCDAETEVRQEIQYYLDDLHDYNSGERTE